MRDPQFVHTMAEEGVIEGTTWGTFTTGRVEVMRVGVSMGLRIAGEWVFCLEIS